MISMKLLALSTLLLAAFRSAHTVKPIFQEGCGCCWPIPPSCCKDPPTTVLPPVTTTPSGPIPTTTTPPITPCRGDVAIILDRTGSVEPGEFDNVKAFVEQLYDATDGYFRTALIPFWSNAPASYDFNDDESTDIGLAITALNEIDAPGGDTVAGAAFISARAALNQDLTPTDGCRAVLMFHDGGSDDKAYAYDRAANLRDTTGARLCLIQMVDPDESAEQMANRLLELETIIENSVDGSELIASVDFVNNDGLDGLLESIIDCLCECPPPETTTLPPLVPTTPSGPLPTTTTPPIPPCRADVAIILDRTGSVEPGEFNYVRSFVEELYDATEGYFRTALIPFWTNAPASYNFNDLASTDIGLAITALSEIGAPGGDTVAGAAFISARAALNQDLTPTDGCRAVLMFHDGGSDDKNYAYDRAANLRDTTGAKLCLIQMVDPDESAEQMANRLLELNTIIDNSVAGSELIASVDFVNNAVPADLLDSIIDCLCECIPPTLVPTTPSGPLPTTTPPPITPCSADVAIVLDRTGSVEPDEFNNLRSFVEVVYTESEGYFRTALIPFWTNAPASYTFNDVAATDIAEATAALIAIGAPGGDTVTGAAFISARAALNQDTNPTDGCRAVLMFHDGGSDDKDYTYDRAANLAATTGVKVCLVQMVDPNETAEQTSNRGTELAAIISNSAAGSELVASIDFVTNSYDMDALLDDILDCICKDCP